MKRLISVLVCAVLAVPLLLSLANASSGFDVGTVRSFTISADDAYTTPVTADSAEAVGALTALMASAKTSAKRPEGAAEIARLDVVSTDKTRSFSLVRSGEAYLLGQGGQYRRVDYSDVNKVVNAVGAGRFYRFREVPTVSVSASADEDFGDYAGIVEGSYSYRRLNGKFTKVQVPVGQSGSRLEITTPELHTPAISRKPGQLSIEVRQGSKSVWKGSGADAVGYQLPKPGEYTVLVTISDDNDWCRYNLTYSYTVNYSASFGFSVEGGDTYLGEVVVLRVKGVTAQDALATYTSDISFNLPPKFHREADGSQIALFPVSYFNAPGQHWVEISCGGKTQRYTINAKDKTWQRQDLAVSSATAEETINSQKANAEYEQVIAPLRSVADQKYWSGRFILPVSDDKVTTEFGMVRYTNGQPTSTRHGALDLAVPRGTPVKAAGTGRVLYAGFLQLTGNTVLIEHGYGLKSWYYHMDSLGVKTGDMVQQGKAIGTVGSTGFSTGPHLHFGMSVNNVFINPYTAINTDLLS